MNYLMTATWPMQVLVFVSNFLLLPLLFYLYIRLVHRSAVLPALGVALLFNSPVMLFQASDLADQVVLANEFSGDAEFSRELSSFDARLSPTLSVDDFISEAALKVEEP